MSDRRRNDEEFAAAERAAEESRRQAEADAVAARQTAREAQGLAERLRALNASNGFAEALMDAVVRGAQ